MTLDVAVHDKRAGARAPRLPMFETKSASGDKTITPIQWRNHGQLRRARKSPDLDASVLHGKLIGWELRESHHHPVGLGPGVGQLEGHGVITALDGIRRDEP
jgi:hypothetical protein